MFKKNRNANNASADDVVERRVLRFCFLLEVSVLLVCKIKLLNETIMLINNLTHYLVLYARSVNKNG